MAKQNKPAVGGGAKKILYTLNTLKQMGIKRSTKALSSRNTCKACGLGMGGQRGGMTNELDEYPSVCNKSIQAQSTDIQNAIPKQLFEQHSLADFQELSAYEIEHLGRLNNPLYKAKHSDQFEAIDWPDAIEIASQKLKATAAERSFFYCSGRSSNEAGFLLQLFARLYGTNNVNNCSYYCHQATGVGLNNAIGSGTATVELADLNRCDVVFLIGANPASNHPRLIHKLKALRERGGHVIVINPALEPGLVRFAVPKSAKSLIFGGTEIASHYLQPKIGGDIPLLQALAKVVLERKQHDEAFINNHCENFEGYAEDIRRLSWEHIKASCGISRADIEAVAEIYANSTRSIFCWGMGVTHHQHGVDNVEEISNLALLRGMVGKPGAGLLPLRGHSNVQGIGSVGVKPVLAEDVVNYLEEMTKREFPKTQGMDTMACLDAALEQKIDLALIMGGNLYSASPNSAWARSALNNIGFKLYLTTTLNHGHVHGQDGSETLILPVCARDEEWQPTTQESMFNFVRMSDGGIERLQNIRPESHILAELASRSLDEPPLDFEQLSSHNNLREFIANSIPSLSELKGIETTKQEFHIKGRVLHQPQFNTQTQRARFLRHSASACDNAEQNLDFPLMLTTVRSEGQFNSIVYEEADHYRSTEHRWSVLMSPTTMRKYGLAEGQTTSIKSVNGEMKNVEVYAFNLPEDNLMAYYPEANVLTGIERDPRSQTPAFKSVNVALF